MDEAKVEERFNQLEKRVSEGFVRMETLIETLANTCLREFGSIAEHFATIDERFTAIDDRLESIEDNIEGFSHRMDNEVEARHQLTERLSKVESHL